MSHTSEFANASVCHTDRVLQPNGSMEQNANHSAYVHYQQLLNSVPGMAGLADATGAVMYFNSAWSQFTGLAPEQSLGWEWCQQIHTDDRDRGLQQWQSALQDSQALETTWQLPDAPHQSRSEA